jgi:hypothetical protein
MVEIGAIGRELEYLRKNRSDSVFSFGYQLGKTFMVKEPSSRPLPDFKPSGASVDILAFLRGYLPIIESSRLNGATRIVVKAGLIAGVYGIIKVPYSDKTYFDDAASEMHAAMTAIGEMLTALPSPKPSRVRGPDGVRIEEPFTVDRGAIEIERFFDDNLKNRDRVRLDDGRWLPPSGALPG